MKIVLCSVIEIWKQIAPIFRLCILIKILNHQLLDLNVQKNKTSDDWTWITIKSLEILTRLINFQYAS